MLAEKGLPPSAIYDYIDVQQKLKPRGEDKVVAIDGREFIQRPDGSLAPLPSVASADSGTTANIENTEYRKKLVDEYYKLYDADRKQAYRFARSYGLDVLPRNDLTGAIIGEDEFVGAMPSAASTQPSAPVPVPLKTPSGWSMK
jgi:hypothetical protein